MSRSFRFNPPELRTNLLPRPRLVRALLGRWQHRVTVISGGAGLGKTTLLGQAIVENELAPRGDDVWIGVRPHDGDGPTLASVVAAALTVRRADAAGPGLEEPTTGEPDPALVADEVWQRSPVEVCLIFDDVHLLEPGSTGGRWLSRLVDVLPANGHVVMATRRSAPPVPLARLDAQDAVLRIGPDELMFSDDEVVAFAARRNVAPARLADAQGWPAVAELTASASPDVAASYLWEEVLEPLGAERRHVLATLCEMGGADDALMSAVLGAPVHLRQVLDGVPLVAAGADGWHVPHGLWRSAPSLALLPAEASAARKRTVNHLVERRRFDDAFELLRETEAWELAPTVLRAACLDSDRFRPRLIARWLSSCPPDVHGSVAGRLAAAVHRASTTPGEAVEPLRAAAAECRVTGDVDAELVTIAHLGRLAWFLRDPSVLGPALVVRIVELADSGHPRAQALAAFGRAVRADVAGDDDLVLAELAGIETGVLDPTWEVMAGWLCGMVHLGRGDAELAGKVLEGLADRGHDPALRPVCDALRLRVWWARGRIDDVLAGFPAALDAVRASGVAPSRHMALTNASIMCSHVGDLATARRLLAEGKAAMPDPHPDHPSVRTALATASLQLAEGHEDEAAGTLRRAAELHGLDQGVDRKGWRQLLPLVYVLLAESRVHWDGLTLQGSMLTARRLAQTLAAGRDGGGTEALRSLSLPDVDLVRSTLHHRLAAELAVGLYAVGRPEAGALLESLGPPGRTAVRALAATDGARRAKAARMLLAAVPAPPRRDTYLEVLGPLVLRRDGPSGPEVVDADLRRQRLRSLLAFLVGHRRTTRVAITAALWPDFDERAASNNLTVTLNYLLRLLEPWRDPDEPAYLIRLDGQRVELVTGQHLHIDADDFDDHVRAAGRADAEGMPSQALAHNLAAVALHRGELHADVPDAAWMALDREHYATRFVRAAVRAGQLLVGRGDTDDADRIARQALAVDPWAEDAHGVLIAAALARDDRSTAGRQLSRCLAAMDELGVEPSAVTLQLARRLRRRPA